MLVVSPKYRRPLNAKQDKLLKLIYKFRFASVDLLAELFSKDRSSIYESLYILGQQNYVSKRYDKSYRLRAKPASYCLAPRGISYLRGNSEFSHTSLRNMYKNKSISEEHIDHCLTNLAVYLALNRQTNKAFNIFSRSELADHSFFRVPQPDLYLSRQQPQEGKQLNYMLDIFDPGLPFWVMKKRIRAYQNHCEEAELPEGQNYPHILLIAPNERAEQKLQAVIEYLLEDFELYTTTLQRLLQPGSPSQNVWRDPFEEAGYQL